VIQPHPSGSVGTAGLRWSGGAEIEETVAWHLALLANEVERQGESSVADLLQQACHHHRAFVTRNRALAMGPGRSGFLWG
jgi:hypothetical protein